ncbi:MAG TPA: glycosyl hydrolase family 28-related protein, partial [Chloroflexia bacterium]|nr:glycosyl hydrolase family 28-related protein [Chloroflexia bacterium]
MAEWTRTAGADESVVLTGYQLSRFSGAEEGKDSRFRIYAAGGVVRDALIQRLDGDKAIITLDKGLPSWGMYLIWPGNDAGWGAPIAVNKTEAWWLQDQAAPGMTVSVFGRNLAKGNTEGTNNAYVYLKGSGASGWATVTKVNPYKVEFTVPSSFTAGTYEVWVHNGHGGEYGWSRPLKLTVVASSQHVLSRSWGAVYNVKDYGAQGNGVSDDRAAINRALAAAGTSGATVYFPSGTYMVSGKLDLSSNTRWLGDKDPGGKPASTIKLMPGFASGTFGLMGGNNLRMNVFENLRLLRDGKDLQGRELVDMRGAQMLWWNNCEIDARGDNAVRLQGSGSSYIYLDKTTFIGGEDQWGNVIYIDGLRQFFANNCTFLMTRDCGAAMMNRGIIESSVTGCIIQDLDNSTTDGSGWGKGRIWSSIGAAGAQYHQYFASNQGKGLGTRRSGPNLPDNNSGEIFLWEANSTMFSGYPTSAGSNTVNFANTVPNRDWTGVPRIMGLTIIEGKGMGQFRLITAQSGGALTVDQPWEVVPDGSSKILIGPYVERIVLYKNSLDANGKPYIA